jgi:hypothetical protein
MTFINVKRTGRVGVPYQGRIYSAAWIADSTTLTVTWHHIEQIAPLKGYEHDPPALAKQLLSEIIRTVSPPVKKA